jgi:hypothetical protein
MLTHLKDTYGNMTPADREANLTQMNAPWSPPTPIEILFQQLEVVHRYATFAAEPIADSQLTRIGLRIITKTGMFPDGCREWRLKSPANQTWAEFKTHFALQDREIIENATSASAGFALSAQAILTNHASATGTALATAATLPTGPELADLLAELAKLHAAASQLVA